MVGRIGKRGDIRKHVLILVFIFIIALAIAYGAMYCGLKNPSGTNTQYNSATVINGGTTTCSFAWTTTSCTIDGAYTRWSYITESPLDHYSSVGTGDLATVCYCSNCENYAGSSVAWSCASTNRNCCSAGYYCIDSAGTCRSGTDNTAYFGSLTYLHSGLNPGGNDNYAFCYSGGANPRWLDCDSSGWYTNWCANTGVCGTTTGVYAGEITGEYTSTSVLGCCGDDANEAYRYGTAVLSGGSARCCSASTDCVDASSTCVNTGTYRDIGATHYMCSSGSWVMVSCYSDTHCTGNCDYCNAGTCAANLGLCSDGYGLCGYPTCTGSGTAYNCGNTANNNGGLCSGNCMTCNNGACNVPLDTLCTGNCDYCSGGTCAANVGLCSDGYGLCGYPTCTGSGTAYNCGNTANNNGGLCSGNCMTCNNGACNAPADSLCTGNCDYCSGGTCAANLGLCSDGYGLCGYPTCTGSGTAYNCGNTADNNGGLCSGNCMTCNMGACNAPADSLCIGNCDYCSGGTCAANVGLCSDGYGLCGYPTCTGSGTAYNCGNTAYGTSTQCNSAWECTSLQNTNNAYNNGAYGYQTQGYCDGSGSCDFSGSTSNPDAGSSSCECVISGIQGTCDIDAEIGCWDGSSCCGDDSGEHWEVTGVGSSRCCGTGLTCVDSSGTCRSGAEICTFNAIDDDCDGECDYDNTYCSKGDNNCPVGVTAISNTGDLCPKASFTVDCTSTVSNVNSVSARIDGQTQCNYVSWIGNVVRFTCTAPTAVGTYTARCYVDSSKSYVSGSDVTDQFTVTNSPTCCSRWTDSTNCEVDTNCDWCLSCVSGNYTGSDTNRCVTANTCRNYCWRGSSCGSTACDANGGCSANSCSGTCPSCSYREYYCSGSCTCLYYSRDPDGSSFYCTGCSRTWSAGGESASFGEYDTGTSTECCGDDSNEYYRGVANSYLSSPRCCNLNTDCVNSANQCIPSGGSDGLNLCVNGLWQTVQCVFDTDCIGNCDRCSSNVCIADSSLCTGDCDVCSGSGNNYNCAASVALCTGNCPQCTGGGTAFSCSGNVATCTGNCDTCSGSGTGPYNCAAVPATCTGNCPQCTGGGTAFSCSGNAATCTGNCDICSGSGTGPYNCAADQNVCLSCNDCIGSGTAFSCSPLSQNNDIIGTNQCNDDCTYCSAGVCINRAQCDTTECAADQYCYIAGGDCTDRDIYSANAEIACEAECGRAVGLFHSFYHNFTGLPDTFEIGTTRQCCGDDANENYTYRICSVTCTTNVNDAACCNANTDCVYNNMCYSAGTNQDVDGDSLSEYCAAQNTWTSVPIGAGCDTGAECGTGNCIDTDATCGGAANCQAPGSGYDGRCCSDDGTNFYTNDGIVTRNAANAWDCDETLGSFFTSDYYGTCTDTNYGVVCDSNSLAGGYVTNGLCGGASHGTCYTNYASDTTSSITASSQFGTQVQVCDTEDTWQCDNIADGSFSPGNQRCDASDDACRVCNFALREDSEVFCETGCGASAFCDEQSRGYESLATDECCNSVCSAVDCDTYDDNSGADASLTESEVSAVSCTSACSGTACCILETRICNSTYQCQRLHNLIPNEDETSNQICYYQNIASWRWNTNAEPSETNCTDGYDNNCDGALEAGCVCLLAPDTSGDQLAVMLAIDRSGSMQSQTSTGATRISIAKSSIINFINIDEWQQTDYVGIASFSSTAVQLQPPLPMTSSNKNQLISTANSIYASGNTALGDAIVVSVNALSGVSADYKYIILLSDGYSNVGSNPYTGAQYAANNNIVIYTVGVGKVDTVLMNAIAFNTGGRYFYASTGNDILDIFTYIGREINNLARSCGPDTNIGLCEYGSQDCVSNIWQGCTGSVFPSPEICDGFDNDCDGLIDESIGGCVCTSQPGGEICDGIDNDCDLVIDEVPQCNCEDIENTCNDFIDNDCDGNCDYDSSFCIHGDDDCSVSITSIRVNNTQPCTNTVVGVNCTISQAGINSVLAYIDQNLNSIPDLGEYCTWKSWVGNTALFDCNSGSQNKKNAICIINESKSFQSGENMSIQLSSGINIPVVTLLSPLSNETITQYWKAAPVVFNFTIDDLSENNFDCTLYINGTTIETKTNLVRYATYNFSRYMNNGAYSWQISCNDFSQCDSIGYSNISNVNILIGENIQIVPIGVTGLNSSSSDCTISTSVALHLAFSPNAASCRYKNEISGAWSQPEPCTSVRLWSLDSAYGLKIVFFNITRNDGSFILVNDTIIYDPYGACFDLTAPQNLIVTQKDRYSNNDSILNAAWYGAYDPEMEKLKQQLTYEYMIKHPDETLFKNWINAGVNNSASYTGSDIDDDTYIFCVRVTNSNNLTSTICSNEGTTIDTISPVVTLASHSLENSWTKDSNLTFTWSSSETGSGIKGYSISLDQNPGTMPDSIVDLSEGNLKTYHNLMDGKYYFHIRAKDNAENLGPTNEIGFIGIDLTSPTKPRVLEPVFYTQANSYTIKWTESMDYPIGASSGVNSYYLNITDITNGSTVVARWVGNILESTENSLQAGHNYQATVIARDAVGRNSSFQGAEDITPPRIVFLKPSGNVINSPILILKTSEQALCKYALDGGDYALFKFTNSTHHEVLIKTNTGSHTVDFLCEDLAGLSVYDTSNFNYISSYPVPPGALSIVQANNVYATFPLKIKATFAPIIGEVRKDAFNIIFNKEKITDFTIEDNGNGVYNISFIPEESGIFNLTINTTVGASNVYASLLDIIVNSFRIEASFVGETPLNIDKKNNIIYAENNGVVFGLASDSKKTIPDDDSGISISSQNDGNLYIFRTKTSRELSTKQNQLTDKSFGQNINSFGARKDDRYYLKSYLNYRELTFGYLLELGEGEYELTIRNSGLGSDDSVVINVYKKR
ncbi:MAG: VWA domain-containing protein [archaeon]